jgi:hypothetical protein
MPYLQLKRHLGVRLPPSTDRRLVLVTGARQVGKTTLVRQVYGGVRYISLDSPEDRQALRAIPAARWATDVGPAVLDEAHKEPSIFEKVKYAYDAEGIGFTALLGSAQILMLERVRETLAGRVFVYELWPLTLAEIAAGGDEPAVPLLARLLEAGRPIGALLGGEPARLLGDDEARRLGAAEHLAAWGGMPELLRLEDEARRDWLRSYHATYLERDLGDLVRLRDLGPFSTFQRLAALRTAGVLSYADLARDAGTSPATARSYLEYLRISYQAFLLPPFARNATSAVVKAPKLHWVDVGLARHFWGMAGVRGAAMPGPLFETLVVAEAVKLVRTLGLSAEPAHYRTRSGMEIDLLLTTSAGTIALEAKGRESAASADFRSLRAFGDALGADFLGGIVVTRGGALGVLPGDPRCWAVPLHRLMS